MQLSAFAAGSVTLAWDASTDPNVAGYNVYFGEASGTYNTNPVNAGNATNVTISGLVPGVTYYFAATTFAASDLESPLSGEVSYLVPLNVPIVNQPPTLNAITNLTINENAGLQTVSLSGISSGATNENQTLAVTAFSSNTGLIPNPTVNYTSTNRTGSLTFAPVTNAFGTATVTVVVHDNGGTANGGVDSVTNTFTVTVNAVNQPPTLSAISNLTISENSGLQTVNLSGITSGAANEIQTLTVTAISSNTGLIPNPTVNYTSTNSTGSLTFVPVANKTGTATVTVTVNDGGTSNSNVTRTFTVTVNAVNQPPTLNAISDLAIFENASAQTVNLSGITSGAANETQTLTVAAISSSGTLIPKPTVKYTSPNTTGSLTFKPALNKTGTVMITVMVNDGGKSNNIVTRTFTVTVTGRPLLSCQLTNQAALVGQTKAFSVSATGSGTLKYQWKFNGTNLSSSVSSLLTLKNIATNQSGVYSVTVTDGNGSTNSTAALTVYATAAGSLAPAGHASGQYTMTVGGVPGCQYIVQASTDFVNWVPLQTNTAPFTFVDTNASQFGKRFYRSVYAP